MRQIPDSETAIDRRSLLKALSFSPLVFGMPILVTGGQDPKRPQQQPDWYRSALQHAKAHGTPVVAFVLPDPKQKEVTTKALKRQKADFPDRLQQLCGTMQVKGVTIVRCGGGLSAFFVIPFEDRTARLAVYLQLLLQSKNVAVQELLLDATYLCAPARLLDAENSETVVLLDSRGRRIGGAIMDMGSEADVVQKLGHLLHGNGRLLRRAHAARTEPVVEALRRLQRDQKDEKKRQAAHDYLVKTVRASIPALIEQRAGHKDARFRQALEEVVRDAYKQASRKDYAGVLPFGTKIEKRRVYDPCPPCGMAVTAAGTRKMLKFLQK